MPTSSLWAGIMLLKHVTHGLFSRMEYCSEVSNASIYKKKREHFDEMWGSHSGACDDYHLWDVMMFGLEGNYWLLEELDAAIFRLDVLGNS
jgi:hypothetical protein